jgi:pimeloyl-ACP methyl ester carboxylesterase
MLSASFGAVAAALLPLEYKQRIDRLCLWNPVLSLRRTFVDPELPWQTENFGGSVIKQALAEGGTLSIDNNFEVGRTFLEEAITLEIGDEFYQYTQPILVLHGDKDTYVSYEVARAICEGRKNCDFVRIPDSEHGFGRRDDEDLVIRLTTNFLSEIEAA